MNKKTPLMTELSPDVLKQLQLTQIEILDEIVRICKKYDLRYFLIYGSLIGAIRHKGFIPWDDDLDIGMPRDDYMKLMEVFQSETSDKFFLQNHKTEPDYWLEFAKVRKNHTLFEEPSLVSMSDTVHKGIFVDIFPFDYVKKNQGLFVHIQFVLSKAIAETLYYEAGVYSDLSSINYKMLYRFFKLFSRQQLLAFQQFIASLQKDKERNYLADFNSARHYLEAIYPIDYFFPIKETEFADRNYQIPSNYDQYLRDVYGDYMVLPKEEDRVNHKTLRIVFNTDDKELK